MLPLSTVFVLIEVRVRYYMGFNVYLVIKEYLLVEYMTFAALHSRNPYFPTAAFPVHIFMCVCVGVYFFRRSQLSFMAKPQSTERMYSCRRCKQTAL